MKDTKFLKAKCGKTGRWYGLEIKQFQGVWKVINMIDLSESEAKVISSEIKQANLTSNSNLIACPGCGSRKVGGCSCAKRRHQCTKNMKYQFDCLYCSELELDYSLPTRSEVSGREGKTVTLSQGQEVQIRYSDDRPLSKIRVGVGWDPATFLRSEIDVDSSVIVMSTKNLGFELKKDLVYFKHLKHPSGCVIHHGDNLTGEDGLFEEDDENISVFLNKVPQDRDCLIFVLNIYDCVNRNQTFRRINNLYLRIYDPDSQKVMVEYKVTGNFNDHTALVIGAAYRKGSSWYFKAIGKGSKAKNVGDLTTECLNTFSHLQ